MRNITTAAGKRLLTHGDPQENIRNQTTYFTTTVLIFPIFFQSVSFDSISGSGTFFQVHYFAVCILAPLYCAYGGPLNGRENRRVFDKFKSSESAPLGHSSVLSLADFQTSPTSCPHLQPLSSSACPSIEPATDRHSSLSTSRTRVIVAVYRIQTDL